MLSKLRLDSRAEKKLTSNNPFKLKLGLKEIFGKIQGIATGCMPNVSDMPIDGVRTHGRVLCYQ